MTTQFAQPQFAMPVPAGHNAYNSSNPYTLYHSQHPTSPGHSGQSTPVPQSPTSPRTLSQLSTQARQLRPLKSPLYVPAVLRPTNRPARKFNVKSTSSSSPPKSSSSSIESNDNESIKGAGRRDTADSAKGGLGRIHEDEFRAARTYAEVTGFPTQRHWKSDSSAQVCDAPACHATFNLFTRRHHCRRCGNIFCDYHSAQTVRLDQDANYHPHGEHVRACDFCLNEYQDWDISRSRSNSQDSTGSRGSDNDSTSEPATPTIGCKGKAGLSVGGLKGVFGKGVAESLGASVPRDWNWSTF